MSNLFPQKSIRKDRWKNRRGAIESIELLISLPILLLVTLGVIHFGLLISNLQHLALASRVGAIAASQVTPESFDEEDVPADIQNAVSHQLEINGIDNYEIHLEYNLGDGVESESMSVGEIECEAPEELDPGPSRNYVRVTVCVRLDELTPNLFPTFGFSIGGATKVARHSTLLRYELN